MLKKIMFPLIVVMVSFPSFSQVDGEGGVNGSVMSPSQNTVVGDSNVAECRDYYSVLENIVPTAVVEITSPSGQVWMDRNLGAVKVGDEGDHYQWGRGNDGHHMAESCISTEPVHFGTEWNCFIATHNSDWLINPDDTRWNSGTEENPVKTEHDPCPTGFRVPTETEMQVEIDAGLNLNSDVIKLPLAGHREATKKGTITNVSVFGNYWSSTVSGNNARFLAADSKPYMYSHTRVTGLSVRCIKE